MTLHLGICVIKHASHARKHVAPGLSNTGFTTAFTIGFTTGVKTRFTTGFMTRVYDSRLAESCGAAT